MRGTVRASTIEDAIYLAPRLREADRAECLAASGKPPEEILPGAIRPDIISFTQVAPSGRPMGIFGVTPMRLIPHVGVVWMLATPELEQHSRQVLRECRGWVDRLHEHFPVLVNLVDARNAVHIRWIEWCGFTLLATRAHGPQGLPFIEFAKVKS